MLFCPSIHVVSLLNMSKDNHHVEFIQYCNNLICEISSLSLGREPESSDLRTSSILQSLIVSIYRYVIFSKPRLLVQRQLVRKSKKIFLSL